MTNFIKYSRLSINMYLLHVVHLWQGLHERLADGLDLHALAEDHDEREDLEQQSRAFKRSLYNQGFRAGARAEVSVWSEPES